MLEEAVKEGKDGVLIRLEVLPGSKDVSFGYNEWRKAVEVRIRSPAREGKANREIVEIFRKVFGEAEILTGERSRFKILRVKGSREDVIKKLKSLLNQKS